MDDVGPGKLLNSVQPQMVGVLQAAYEAIQDACITLQMLHKS